MKKSIVREYFESLVVAVILALFVRTWVFQAFKIPTGSMEPNLLVGDHLIVNKMRFAPIRRGDVVVFKFPKDPERDFVKRVIGLPGDKIELHRKKVYVNGVALNEPYAHFMEPASTDGAPKVDDVREEYGPVNVPADQYFMMGDNRDNSEDSRYWGFLPKSYVKGNAEFLYFSVDDQASLVSGARWERLGKIVK
ncbi:MAG: signal peptidase I [Acidobacteriota bacterium]